MTDLDTAQRGLYLKGKGKESENVEYNVKRSPKMASDKFDSGFISPTTKTLDLLHANDDSSTHTSDDFTTPYYLRASSRCGSSPFPLSTCTTPYVGGSSKSSPHLPSATSTPANTNYVSSDQFQKRLNNLEEASYSSDGSNNQDTDSGIESLIVSPRNSTVNLFEDSTKIGLFAVDSSKFSPIAQRFLGAVPKRRSPRQVGHKVDGIERLTRILKGNKRENGSAKNGDLENYSASAQFIEPYIEKFEGKPDIKGISVKDPSREGRETVDILRYLYEKDFVFILDKIFQYLAPCDLCNLAQVSQLWNLGLQSRKDHDNRRKDFVTLKKLDRENWGNVRITRSSPRRAMTDLANVNRVSPSAKRDRNPSCSALLSPSKIRHRLFMEEAAKLSPGERLVHCPLCTSPCRVTTATPPTTCITRANATPPSIPSASPSCSSSRTNDTQPASKSTPCLTSQAICSSAKCRFVFCPACHCEGHPGRPCRVTRSGKSGTVTSKKSKARLRRL